MNHYTYCFKIYLFDNYFSSIASFTRRTITYLLRQYSDLAKVNHFNDL